MKKIAKLITFSLTTRVIVDADATDDEIIAAAYTGIQDKIDNRELGDNCTEIEDDTEVPFGTGHNEHECLNCGNQYIGETFNDELGEHGVCVCGSSSDK